jgi:hypothetical protein
MLLSGENQRTRRETFPSTTLSTTNPTWTALGTNLGPRSEKLATNCLSYGTASKQRMLLLNFMSLVLLCMMLFKCSWVHTKLSYCILDRWIIINCLGMTLRQRMNV